MRLEKLAALAGYDDVEAFAVMMMRERSGRRALPERGQALDNNFRTDYFAGRAAVEFFDWLAAGGVTDHGD